MTTAQVEGRPSMKKKAATVLGRPTESLKSSSLIAQSQVPGNSNSADALEAGKARANWARQYRESIAPPNPARGSISATAKGTLAGIIEFDEPSPAKVRLRELWLAAMAVRAKGDRAKLQQQFMDHARKSGLMKAASEHYAAKKQPRCWGEEDVAHIIRWGLRGMDPWCPGEFPNG